MDITVIQTGGQYNNPAYTFHVIHSHGTIDQVLRNSRNGIEVSEEPAIIQILDRARVSNKPTVIKACNKNSTDLTESDLNKMATLCTECMTSKILITHGTDTMVDTAQFMANLKIDKTIVLVGAFLPETFKMSDADFNIGFALGVLELLSEKTVFIAMNGKVFHWSKVSHEMGLNYFE